MKNKLFFFGSWERYKAGRGGQYTYGVPTARMRAGDFTEVAAAYSKFQLYNPLTGGAGGVGRTPFANFTIPSNLISPIAQQVMSYYPLPNTTQGPELQPARRRLRTGARDPGRPATTTTSS